jgi:hypothetical protein
VIIDLSQQLSPHFALRELVTTAHRYIDNTPTPEIIERLRVLCVEFLEPIRAVYGPLWVTSGFRCLELNTAIGGSETSAHVYGCAVDFVPVFGQSTTDIVRWLVAVGLPFDQVIDEHSSTSNWVHLGMAKPGRAPRRQALTMRNGIYTAFAA